MYTLNIWKTDENSKIQKCQPDQNLNSGLANTGIEAIKLQVNSSKEFQEIMGFGGAFNEVGWEAVNCLAGNERSTVFEALFGKEGCRFGLCRTPMGASDFGLDGYSLNDVEGDISMEHFDISRDKTRLIPYILEALKTNPSMKVWGCPWSPPYWMKTTGDMCNGGELLDTPEILNAYAVYFTKYVQAYKEAGVDILAVCIQNETDVINIYPTSTMTPELMQKFIRAYLVPKFIKAEGKPLKTEIWVGSIRNVMGYADVVVTDPVVKQFIKGIGYQYSTPEVVRDSYDKYPKTKLLHTESPCHNGANSWAEACEIFNDVISYLENGCVNYSYWNMILDEREISSWGWKQNSMLTINRHTREVKYNNEYYVMKHFSYFIQPGAKRVATSGDKESTYIAFKNPDNSIVLLVSNFTEEKKLLDINIDGESVKAVLDPSSIYTMQLSR